MPKTQQLEDLTIQVRRDILRMVHKVNSGHPGGSLGCAEFFVALYSEIMEKFPGIGLIASGGIASMAEILKLDEMGVPGVITGKAIYENRITLKEISKFIAL